MSDTTELVCTCGRVHIEVEGKPIISAECYCNSCREGAARLAALPGGKPYLTDIGGTPYVLYRKDRVRFTVGQDLLREFRLTPTSHTRRVVAGCCNTPIFTEFQNGHWLSLYAGLWPAAQRPAMQVRTVTSDLPADTMLDDRLPNAKSQNFAFIAGLMGAWIAMGFKVPKVEVPGTIEA